VIRTPDQRLRVFVSSTLEELAEERAAAREAIESLRLTPVLFELAARVHPPRQLYGAYLEQSDVFVGIYGERYGWVAPDMEISGLEDEYGLARAKPRLLYVKRPAEGRDERLQALIGRIEAEGDVSYRSYGSAAELRALLENDLAVLLSERFRPEAGDEPALRLSVPAAVDRFVGRADVLEALLALLSDPTVRLVTVTGPGGVGKTRLALEAARSRNGRSEGAHFVSLAPVVEPELVLETIVGSLELPAANAESPLAALTDGLGDSSLLLVLDNFEHVLPAAGELGRLLETCPHVTLLVTSRVVLKLKGERELPVHPLTVPADGALDGNEAVALFVDRASAASPAFVLGDANRAAVAEICRRLDGLPLALELAAARVRLLPPEAMLERLGSGLELAESGGAGYPDRQRTMRATLDWSYALLDESARVAFARASVFRGGWALPAFDEVCGGIDALGALATLVDASLVRAATESAGPRFLVLETIREYASEKLAGSGDADEAAERHASFYLDLVEAAGAGLRAAGHAPWLARLDDDEDNVRAALRWSLDRGEIERVADAAWALTPYWLLREQLAEGRRLVAEACAGPNELLAPTRAKLLTADGYLAFWGSDFPAAAAALTEALGTFQALGDEARAAVAQLPLGVLAGMRGDTDASRHLLEASRRALEEQGDEWGLALAEIGLGFTLNVAGADAPLEDYERLVTRAARLGREAETIALGVLAQRRAIRGERREAKDVFGEALRRAVEFKAALGVRWYLEQLADLAMDEEEYALAGRLSAAADSAFDLSAAPGSPFVGERANRLPALVAHLGQDAFDAETAAGRGLGAEAACAQALEWIESASGPG
jgi:predicted ATPase